MDLLCVDADKEDTIALRSALSTLALERKALAGLEAALAVPPLADAFAQSADVIRRSTGRVIATGMGKSGLVARKLAATFASTGTPAFFLHPAEASHGDLGMIAAQDVVLALSWSGETGELSDVVAYCARFEVPLIGMTSQPQSTLARCASVSLLLPNVQEACPYDLAPTSSTIVQGALGDALAVALLEMRGFSADDFRVFHPKGQLGVRLVRVSDLMSSGDALPRVRANTPIADAIIEMSLGRLGVVAVVDHDDFLVGAFTDGDLRRSLSDIDFSRPVHAHMTLRPVKVKPDALASEALAKMNAHAILQLFVCADDDRLIGVVHLHDVVRAGVV